MPTQQMTQDTIRRLIAFALVGASLLLQPLLAKWGLHLSGPQLAGYAGFASVYIVQSCYKAVAQHKALVTGMADIQKVLGFLQRVRAAQTGADGLAAAATAPTPGSPGGPSQA